MSDTTATSTDVETFENTEESTKINTVANIAVLSFAVIGAVQTARFATVAIRGGLVAIKKARAAKETETVAHAVSPTE